MREGPRLLSLQTESAFAPLWSLSLSVSASAWLLESTSREQEPGSVVCSAAVPLLASGDKNPGQIASFCPWKHEPDYSRCYFLGISAVASFPRLDCLSVLTARSEQLSQHQRWFGVQAKGVLDSRTLLVPVMSCVTEMFWVMPQK